MEVQEVTPLTKACLLPKGYLVIVGVGGVSFKNVGCKEHPTILQPHRVWRARGSLVLRQWGVAIQGCGVAAADGPRRGSRRRRRWASLTETATARDIHGD